MKGSQVIHLSRPGLAGFRWTSLVGVLFVLMVAVILGTGCPLEDDDTTSLNRLEGNWRWRYRASDRPSGDETVRDVKVIISRDTITFLPFVEGLPDHSHPDVEGGYVSGSISSFRIVMQLPDPPSSEQCQEGVVSRVFTGSLVDGWLKGTYEERRLSRGATCREIDRQERRVTGGVFAAQPLEEAMWADSQKKAGWGGADIGSVSVSAFDQERGWHE